MSRRVRLSPTPTPWHPGYPFRARGGKARRVASTLTLASLLTLIGGYYYFTDSRRVKALAQKYLTDVVGGPVRIERARLSIFEGLRLDGVTVDADDRQAPDSRLLTAESLHVSFSITSLLRGSLSDVAITAVGPHVTLVSEASGDSWNFQRLRRIQPSTRPTEPRSTEALSLPRVSVRDAKISYAELKDGKLTTRGVVAVEGTLSPASSSAANRAGPTRLEDSDRYAFAVTLRSIELGRPSTDSPNIVEPGKPIATPSRSPSSLSHPPSSATSDGAAFLGGLMNSTKAHRAGSSFTGWVQLSTGAWSAKALNIDLGPDMEAMLPGPVRDWWQRHEIAGSFDIPELSFEPPTADKPRTFRVLVSFDKGAAALHPEEFQTSDSPRIPSGLPPIRFSDVRGQLLFTDAGIDLRDMSFVHEGNRIDISGSLAGYTPNAAFSISVSCDKLLLPESPSFVPSLPPEPREVWDRFQPSGEGRFSFNIARDDKGKFVMNGRADATRAKMTFENFPYPCHNISGAVLLTSLEPGKTQLEVRGVKGYGKPGTANEKAEFKIDGKMAPLEGDSEVDFIITGTNVEGDELMVAAMPEDVRRGMAHFDPVNKKHPEFGGNFHLKVYRYPGKVSRWLWPIDINITHGSGSFDEFAYPLENIAGQVEIRSGRVNIKDITARRKGLTTGDALLTVNGNVTYGEHSPGGRLHYDLALKGSNVPVDATLVRAVPEDNRQWLTRLGVSGMLTIDGRITGNNATYDLGVQLANGELLPEPEAPAAASPATATPGAPRWKATDLQGVFRIKPNTFMIERATANRLGAPLAASGVITWGNNQLGRVTLDIAGKAIPLDPELRSILPVEARSGWDSVNPEGRADFTLAYRPDRPCRTVIRAQNAAMTPAIVPVRFAEVAGQIVIEGEKITLSNLTAARNGGRLTLSGTGSTSARGPWDVVLSAKNTDFDAALRDALPAMLKETVASLGLSGRADVEVRRLAFTPQLAEPSVSVAPDASAATAAVLPAAAIAPPAATPPPANVDFDLSLRPTDLTLQVGVAIHITDGDIKLAGSVRNNRLSDLNGDLRFRTGEMAGRAFTNLGASLNKSPGLPGISLNSITGNLADGELAGRAAIAFPEGQPTRYAMELLLRNADVRQLVASGQSAAADAVAGPRSPIAPNPNDGLAGRLSASLSLEGTVNDASTRRGRGDISVSGERLARIPVLLGLVQVANLTLPSNTSFNNASARYVLDGPRINFDQLAIRSPDFEMIGNGKIDLEQRDVRLTFWTAPPDLPKVPVLSDLADRARRELLQIQVRGTIDDPKFGASSFDSFTTTVDEVFKSSGRSGSTTRK